MKEILQSLFEHKTLSRGEAREVLLDVGRGRHNEHSVTAFMTVYLMRSITIEELLGFRDALLELCHPVNMGSGRSSVRFGFRAGTAPPPGLCSRFSEAPCRRA